MTTLAETKDVMDDLIKDGLVFKRKDGKYDLTAKGRKQAQQVELLRKTSTDGVLQN